MLLKYLAYGALIGIYAAFAWAGKTPVEGLIGILSAGLGQLAGYHIQEQKVPTAPVIVPTIVTEEK